MIRYYPPMFRRIALAGLAVLTVVHLAGPGAPAVRGQAPLQAIDEEYTKLIREHLQDPRISTELVDHLPASDTVPTPLKFFGRIVGTPGELTYAEDIHRYYAALAQASGRARYWTIGTTEEDATSSFSPLRMKRRSPRSIHTRSASTR